MVYSYRENIRKPMPNILYNTKLIIFTIMMLFIFTLNNFASQAVVKKQENLVLREEVEEINRYCEPNLDLEELQEPEINLKDIDKIREGEIRGFYGPNHIEPKYSDKNFSLDSPINTYSGLSEDDIKTITSDYREINVLSGSLYQMEVKYKINVFYILGVMTLESFYGTSDYAINRNNLCGILIRGKGKYFSSKYECLDYFSRLMNDYYIPNGLKSPGVIQPVYEPANRKWDDDVVWFMNMYSDRYYKEQKVR